MTYPDYPVPIGVFRNIRKPTYDELMKGQAERSIELFGKGDLQKLFTTGDTWVVE